MHTATATRPYNTAGHVCPLTGRRAISLTDYRQLPADTVCYLYIEWSAEPWRLLLGVMPTRYGSLELWFVSGCVIEVDEPDKRYVYVK